MCQMLSHVIMLHPQAASCMVMGCAIKASVTKLVVIRLLILQKKKMDAVYVVVLVVAMVVSVSFNFDILNYNSLKI